MPVTAKFPELGAFLTVPGGLWVALTQVRRIYLGCMPKGARAHAPISRSGNIVTG